jgi:ABC-type dipeptide/oligopeptide/nickel transport system permease component
MTSHRFAFIGKRIVQTIPLLLVVLVAVFSMLKLVPGDPARQVAGPRASEAQIAVVREQLGLNESLPAQFFGYLSRIVHGDLGMTANGALHVSDVIRQNAPVTALVLSITIVFTALIAIPLAMLASHRPNGVIDRGLQVMATFGVGIPTFWMGIVLLAVVALPTGAFPTGGWGDTFAEQLRASTLPALALSISVAPILFASLRSSIIEVKRSDYYTAARAAGVEGSRLIRKFVLRNAAVPPIALLAALTTILLSGVVVVEATFGLPGLGQTLVEGAKKRDFNVVQGLTLLFTVCVVGVNLLGDVLIAIVDPRVELS